MKRPVIPVCTRVDPRVYAQFRKTRLYRDLHQNIGMAMEAAMRAVIDKEAASQEATSRGAAGPEV